MKGIKGLISFFKSQNDESGKKGYRLVIKQDKLYTLGYWFLF